MTATTTTAPSNRLDTTSHGSDRKSSTAAITLSVRRLNIMRIGYLVMGLGLAVTRWPSLFTRTEPWPLYEGVTTYMLVAMGLLALLGLRHPVQMLPILLFESAWKLLWLAAVALPLWAADGMDRATSEVASASLWVAIVLAVIPWRYVVAQFVTRQGDLWRAGGGRARRSHGAASPDGGR